MVTVCTTWNLAFHYTFFAFISLCLQNSMTIVYEVCEEYALFVHVHALIIPYVVCDTDSLIGQ